MVVHMRMRKAGATQCREITPISHLSQFTEICKHDLPVVKIPMVSQYLGRFFNDVMGPQVLSMDIIAWLTPVLE